MTTKRGDSRHVGVRHPETMETGMGRPQATVRLSPSGGPSGTIFTADSLFRRDDWRKRCQSPEGQLALVMLLSNAYVRRWRVMVGSDNRRCRTVSVRMKIPAPIMTSAMRARQTRVTADIIVSPMSQRKTGVMRPTISCYPTRIRSGVLQTDFTARREGFGGG